MSDQKQYDTVSEMVSELIDDQEAIESINEEIDNQRLSSILFSIRCQHGLTQEEMAKKIGCTQSRISKLEHAHIDQISVKDLEDYSNALDIDIIIRFQHKMDAVESVKHHFFEIKKHLDRLRQLADDDPDIVQGVDRFYNEWLLNTLRHYLEGKKALGTSQTSTTEPSFQVVGPEESEDEKQFIESLTK